MNHVKSLIACLGLALTSAGCWVHAGPDRPRGYHHGGRERVVVVHDRDEHRR